MKRLVPVLCLFLASTTIFAQSRPVPAPPIIGATSYLMIDAKSGHELASLKPDAPVPPASLTKLMTTYVVFHAIEEGQITLEDEVTISEKAWRMQGSRMFIEVGTRVRVKDLLLGVIVQSGNDASVALAEYVAGSEEVFAAMMNQYAQALGMTSTHFVNATGWPDDEHYSTARDLAILARALIGEFPEHYQWHAIKEFQWGDIKQPNRNRLLWRDDSVDGLKTGHTESAGYCLVASAERDGMRIISVVLGTASDKSRIDGSQAMINYGFRFFETRLLYKAGEEITRARVWKSASEYSSLGVMEDLYITVPRGAYDSLESVHNMPAIIEAPVATGQPLGELKVSLNDEILLQQQLRALEDNPSGSFWQRIVDTVMLWLE
ncbi:MAG: D-alanyl-D-alanine carboxypeptidase [Gammaproteobacteria bacterium]|jgi:D-alanyl-D-alanine carboxypeptidase (penicillin-binding protein 5/6)|nr:D-alanyl-D-alanine carboxypeptidase [Gammaproteobacteria bacterium]MDH3863372.1 D-alanyl-D-alanine carboxypeptidase [Gammaproteobacteria bacterium]MDH3904840.1 D-alanyl-D-alanine carboxypeptidase [Gammaproteobacteria bacterium]MDH3954591.1 D-alanyl-D-alanine carboxypeptidase [Gammaproteobacteria bacterium]MDH4003858.1 D-alanyl-D-alanine carboxypeptidase [Gammaproteobacteria bacterium]